MKNPLGLRTEYKYDKNGNIAKIVTAGSLTEYYYYDSGHLSYITNSSNTLKYFFTRDDQGKLINMVDWTSTPHTTYWYIFDAYDSVIGLVDDSGQFVVNYQYSSFGEIISSSGTVTTGDGTLLKEANPFLYNSYQYDIESGFYYLKSRYYIPSLGRYLNKDVIQGENIYTFCNNNPITNEYPSGYIVY